MHGHARWWERMLARASNDVRFDLFETDSWVNRHKQIQSNLWFIPSCHCI